MSASRRSAFSVYSENKPETKVNEESQSKKTKTEPNQNGSKSSGNDKRYVVPNNNKTAKYQHVQNQNGFGSKGKKHEKFSSNGNDHHHANNTVVVPHEKLSGVVKRNKSKADKKEKMKFAKLPFEKITESIGLFGNNQAKRAFSLAELHNPRINDTKPKNQPKNNQRAKSFESKPALKNLLVQQTVKEKSKKPKSKPATVEESPEDMNVEESSTAFYQVNSEMFDSRLEAMNLFKKMINPVKLKEFFSSYWEKRPLLIKRENPGYYNNWFSCKEFDTILRNHSLEFTQNIDITTYVNNVKQKHNLEGRAYAPLVWDFFQQGCSIRLLNPSTYSKNIWQYLSQLQELFGSCVGANIYLTPAGTQGFAPHYDDIEAFVLQLEGRKRWRVYKPLEASEVLPRFSSANYSPDEIGEPIIDCILERGDFLYFPRGYIHQANACDDIHSLHITVSTYQKNSWGDFLSKLLPGAVEIAMRENVEFRRGLPINYLLHNGIAFDEVNDSKDRNEFAKKTVSLIKKLAEYAPIDAAVDQMGKQFIHDSMPPCFTEYEKSRSIHGHGETWNEKKNRVDNISEIDPDTSIKLIRKNCLRLVIEENSCLVYHNLDNGRVYHDKEPQYLEVEPEVAPAIEFLIKMYPKYATVEELPLKTMEEKIVVASCLYDKGLLVTGEPLEFAFGDDDDSDECSGEESGDECDEDDDDGDEDDEELAEVDDESDGDEVDDFNSDEYDTFNEENGDGSNGNQNGQSESGDDDDEDDDENNADE